MTIPTFARRVLAAASFLHLAAATPAWAITANDERADGESGAMRDASGGDTTLKPGDQLFDEKEYRLEQKLGPDLSVNSHMRLEAPERRASTRIAPERDGAGVEAGLYLDQLFVTYETDHAGMRLGKYRGLDFGAPRLGAGDVGMFGHDRPLDAYRQGSAIGVNPFAKFDAGLGGALRLDASIHRPERAEDTAAIGTPYETQALPELAPSTMATLSARNALGIAGFGYHLGLQSLSPDPAGDDVERSGAMAGLSYGTSFGGNRLRSVAEFGYMRETGPDGGETLNPSLAVTGVLNDSWRAFANYARSYAPDEAAADAGELRYGAGLGYKFSQGPSLDMSWQRRTERDFSADESRQDDIGVRMRYDLKF